MTAKNLKKAETQLKKAEQKLQQKQARLDEVKVRQKKQTRKDDTRRKTLLGSALMAAGKKDSMAQQTIDALIATMDAQDRHRFKVDTTSPDTSQNPSSTPTAATSGGDEGNI